MEEGNLIKTFWVREFDEHNFILINMEDVDKESVVEIVFQLYSEDLGYDISPIKEVVRDMEFEDFDDMKYNDVTPVKIKSEDKEKVFEIKLVEMKESIWESELEGLKTENNNIREIGDDSN